ncbi:hypothetical protein KPH14_007749 [Odynerus spinipes]|uniref:Uncharacterized protein n=1 Tax=Odynerus spinipes TaxID=1348599 RepID=A0AAD9RJZ5_9HYME|nr:hypothetical protein KPH14_007749 [Odynerus spinipes]
MKQKLIICQKDELIIFDSLQLGFSSSLHYTYSKKNTQILTKTIESIIFKSWMTADIRDFWLCMETDILDYL